MNTRYRLMLLALSGSAWCAKKVDLDYHVKLLPQSEQAEVRVSLSQGAAVRSGFLDHGMDMLTKPFQIDTLAVKVRQMLAP